MYKVFINEKRLTLSKSPSNNEKNIAFESMQSIEIAVDLLENTSKESLTVYHDDLDNLWQSFKSYYKLVGAAGGIVKNSNGEYLFIHRLGKWDLPKGKIEKDETVETAALREVEEETSLTDLVLKSKIGETYHTYRERGTNKRILKTTDWYSMDYEGLANPKPQKEEGITKAEWKSQEQIKKDVVDHTFKNILLILKQSEII